jgi:hypothetical protein
VDRSVGDSPLTGPESTAVVQQVEEWFEWQGLPTELVAIGDDDLLEDGPPSGDVPESACYWACTDNEHTHASLPFGEKPRSRPSSSILAADVGPLTPHRTFKLIVRPQSSVNKSRKSLPPLSG